MLAVTMFMVAISRSFSSTQSAKARECHCSGLCNRKTRRESRCTNIAGCATIFKPTPNSSELATNSANLLNLFIFAIVAKTFFYAHTFFLSTFTTRTFIKIEITTGAKRLSIYSARHFAQFTAPGTHLLFSSAIRTKNIFAFSVCNPLQFSTLRTNLFVCIEVATIANGAFG